VSWLPQTTEGSLSQARRGRTGGRVWDLRRPAATCSRAAEDGNIDLEWLYDPRYEDPPLSGAAADACLYWDAGTGAVDYSAPHATVSLGNPTSAARYTYQSAPLTDGQTYRFVVKVATAPWPAGIETQNTDEHTVMVDTEQPDAPELVLELV